MPKGTKQSETAGPGKRFSKMLLEWNTRANRRQMPWKGEKDPYKIWLSEIILQQTRVEQGLAYYNNFIAAFPNVELLAAAPEEKVFKLWEGLGYYTRCRNLIATAKQIAFELNGQFPDKFEAILALKGIGPYTAAAISSFAFGLPHAVLDGNVYRVLSRVFGISEHVDTTNGKRVFASLAEALIDKKEPAAYNQAIMDFGATICKPANPLCVECVFRKDCHAYQFDKIDVLPLKSKRLIIKKRWFYYMVISYKGQLAVRQRTTKDIWQQLYEFPMIEFGNEQEPASVLEIAKNNEWLPKNSISLSVSPLFKQQLTHQSIHGRFIEFELDRKPSGNNDWIWLKRENISKYSFPRFIHQYLEFYNTAAVVK
jgi:A/G-specific adenine glycosylase